MMTKEQMIDRYEELYHKMATSKEPKYMRVFGESEKWVFAEVAKAHPELAESWLSHLEAICWENHLNEKEAMNISKRITNQDGTKGFHWDCNTLFSAVESLGGKIEEKPYYDKYALATTMNMIYSDHANSIALDMGYKTPKEVPNEDMALSVYRKAVEKLKDVDGGFHVRKYFKSKMYADSPM